MNIHENCATKLQLPVSSRTFVPSPIATAPTSLIEIAPKIGEMLNHGARAAAFCAAPGPVKENRLFNRVELLPAKLYGGSDIEIVEFDVSQEDWT